MTSPLRRLMVGLCAMAVAGVGLAQTPTTASLKGRILDGAGDGIPGVVVTLTNPEAAVGELSAVTDIGGDYVFQLLPPGAGYTLKASVPGYATVVAGPFDLDAGRTTIQNLTLKPSRELEETVRVEARGEIVDISSTRTSTTYSTEFIEGLPLLGRRFNDVLTLAPGVTDPDGDGNPNVRGSRDTGLQLRVDGTNTSDPLNGHFGQDINLETVEEIEIITSGAAAEFGRADGGFANVITKSGGNRTQGSAKIFFRSRFLDGDGAGNNDGNPNEIVSVPDFTDTRSFFSMGGAFVKDRLWYFGSVERLDRAEPVIFTTGGSTLTTQEGWNAFAKITWQAGNDNKLALQLSYDPLEVGGNYIGSRTPEESDFLVRTGGPLVQLKWTSIISPRLLLEALVSHLDGGQAIDPVSPDFERIQVATAADAFGLRYVRLPCRTINCQQDRSIFTYQQTFLGFRHPRTLTSVHGPYYFKDDDQRERSTFKADLSYNLDEVLGSHAFKTGFEFNDERYADNPIYNPILTDRTQSGGRCPFFPPPPPSIRCGSLVLDVFDPVQQEVSAVGFDAGAFVQDSWKILPNLTINAGVRLDHERIDSAGFTPFDPVLEAREVLRRFDILCDAAGNPCTSARVPGFTTQGLPGVISLSNVPPGHPAHRFDLDGDGFVDLARGSPEFAHYISPMTLPPERETEGFSISNANLAPRLSLSWDPWGDGRTKIFGTWNRYYDRLFLGAATSEQLPRRFTAEWLLQSVAQQAEPDSYSRPLSGVVSIDQVDRDLATPYTDEWSVGFERELAPEWAVSMTYISRRGQALLQDQDVNHITCNLFDRTYGVAPMDVCGDGGELELDRFGHSIAPDPNNNPSFLLRVPNGAIDLYVLNPYWNQVLRTGNYNSSKYVSTELALRKRLHRNWQMQLGYTHSVATGQAEKFVDLAGNDPAISDTVFGYLDFDQRHVLKWQAVTRLPHGVVLGGAVQWASGLPFSIVGTTTDEDDRGNLTAQRIYFPTKQKNDNRNGAQWTFSGRVEKSLDLSRVRASVFLSGENLTDEDDLRIIAVRTGSRGTGVDGEKRFGRRWEIGAAFEF